MSSPLSLPHLSIDTSFISRHLSISLSHSLPLPFLPLYLSPLSGPSLSISPSQSLSICRPLSLPLSLNLSPPSLDLSPPPLISIDRNLPISQQLSYLPLSISLPLSPLIYLPPLSTPFIALSLISPCLFISRHLSTSFLSRSFSPLFSSPLPPISLSIDASLSLNTSLSPSTPPSISPSFFHSLYLPSRSLSPPPSLEFDLDLSWSLSIPRYISTPIHLPLSNSPFLWNPLSISSPLSIPISQHLSISLPRSPSLYLTLSVPSLCPLSSFSWSLSIDSYLSTPLYLPLSPFSLSRSLHIYFDLSPSPLSRYFPLDVSLLSRSLERYPSICRHLSISICLPPSRSLPFALSLPPISISPLSYDLYRYLYFSTPLYIHISPLAPSLDLSPDTSLSLTLIYLTLYQCFYFFITIHHSLSLCRSHYMTASFSADLSRPHLSHSKSLSRSLSISIISG